MNTAEVINPDTRFDLIIADMVEHYFPELVRDLTEFGPLWLRAQIWQESRFDPLAISPSGAKGLMQLMPGTALEMGVSDCFDPVQNIRGGVQYLAIQYRHLSEIPEYKERLRFALASYNGGRGYINKALEIARAAEGLPVAFKDWQRGGHIPGWWQMWQQASSRLKDSACVVNGQRPDYRQMIDYVHRIEARFSVYLTEAGVQRRHPAWS
ncbi:transglycosylase SLT domain-containing protein [Geopsychrobacter electrodiphilus]|uniref:transglycosylase SLT domain-containing protein n=1 Tax=Geopsychrobacter electrodiphilus TaxID=225196 RepID=UPI00036573A7|nr:transglycosylase SLT domain-containing protein [Geopsychrobacter electrodiphilus]